MSYIFVLGAGDPEMSAIERICRGKNIHLYTRAFEGSVCMLEMLIKLIQLISMHIRA